MLEIEEQLQCYGAAIEVELLQQEDAPPGSPRHNAASPPAWDEATGQSVGDRIASPRRRRWVSALVAAAVVLALVIAIGALTRATDSTQPASTIQRLVNGTWQELPPSPLGDLGRAQAFSTSQGILVWGEYDSAAKPRGFHGAIYNPTSRAWRRIAEPPVALTLQGEWTERALVFPRAGLAYDVKNDEWRRIEEAPFLPGSSALYTWTGQELVVVSPECDPLDDPTCAASTASEVAAYSPSKDRWRTLPAPPPSGPWQAIGPTRGGFVLWSSGPTGTQASANQLFDFSRNSWRPVAQSPPDTGPSAAAAIASTGRTPAWVGWFAPSNGGELRAARLSGDSWQVLRSLPHPFICGVHAFPGPRGTAVVSCDSAEALLLDVVRDRWFQLPNAQRGLRALTWTGDELYALSHHGRLTALE